MYHSPPSTQTEDNGHAVICPNSTIATGQGTVLSNVARGGLLLSSASAPVRTFGGGKNGEISRMEAQRLGPKAYRIR